jgi:predicted DNA helicase
MSYITRFLTLIEYERKAEIQRHQKEIETLSASQRQKMGRCEYGLKGSRESRLFHYTVVKFSKPQPLDTKISAGDLVLISQGDPQASDLTGTVTQSQSWGITVAFENPPPHWVYQQKIRIDLYANDISFVRMKENLLRFYHQKHPLKALILDERKTYPPKPIDFEPENQNLNTSQCQAIADSLGARDLFLIHGPPGTGKTTTLGELIFQASIRGKKVLATAESNIAADNLLIKLAQYPDLTIVRVGHPARIMEGYEAFSLWHHFQNHPQAQKIQNLKREKQNQKSQQKKYRKPAPIIRRGLSDREIERAAHHHKSPRGLRREEIRSMYQWLKNQKKIEKLDQEMKELEKEIFAQIIDNADVVVSTNSMAGSEVMESAYFDLSVIDEGSQQVEPSTLIPLLKAKRVIIAGDDRQLPPTVISLESQDLMETFFNRMKKRHPQNCRMLQIQYRMNETLLDFPRKAFYDQTLTAHPSVQHQTLRQKLPQYLQNAKPVVFLDTSRIDLFPNAQGVLLNLKKDKNEIDPRTKEHQNRETKSYENEFEAIGVKKIVFDLIGSGINPKEIGIITPYQGQVRRLKKQFESIRVTVESIDGFQGREKEIILLSLVRANEMGSLGFLKDLRRLNVALTRAQKKLIVIGHGPTLKNDSVYRQWIDWVFGEQNEIKPKNT